MKTASRLIIIIALTTVCSIAAILLVISLIADEDSTTRRAWCDIRGGVFTITVRTGECLAPTVLQRIQCGWHRGHFIYRTSPYGGPLGKNGMTCVW